MINTKSSSANTATISLVALPLSDCNKCCPIQHIKCKGPTYCTLSVSWSSHKYCEELGPSASYFCLVNLHPLMHKISYLLALEVLRKTRKGKVCSEIINT